MNAPRTYNFVHWNSIHQRHQNVDITWMIVDQSSGQRDGSPLHIGEDALITSVFQTLKSEISVPIDTDICSLRSWRASSPTNTNRLKLLGLMTMTGTWPVSDRILCYFRSSFHLTIGFFSFMFYTFITIKTHSFILVHYTNEYQKFARHCVYKPIRICALLFLGINST